jgi:hypothetical protein
MILSLMSVDFWSNENMSVLCKNTSSSKLRTCKHWSQYVSKTRVTWGKNALQIKRMRLNALHMTKNEFIRVVNQGRCVKTQKYRFSSKSWRSNAVLFKFFSWVIKKIFQIDIVDEIPIQIISIFLDLTNSRTIL